MKLRFVLGQSILCLKFDLVHTVLACMSLITLPCDKRSHPMLHDVPICHGASGNYIATRKAEICMLDEVEMSIGHELYLSGTRL